jgi:hypothetical protein
MDGDDLGRHPRGQLELGIVEGDIPQQLGIRVGGIPAAKLLRLSADADERVWPSGSSTRLRMTSPTACMP